MSVFQNQESKSEAKEEAERMMDSVPMTAGDPVATMAVGSVLYAWYKFYVKGDREGGIFVGLWAPTLLAAASYLQQKNIVQKFKRGLSSF
ncbi:hypothetical protein [Halorubellus sp. JP-L1]|uniref:hypothetical protein n=1 Tax=Halorubellus sp. JP-L1 TaxID=2715753 RepID=UPI001F0475E0|nr:hypothetical protein [Halorubellus sp. JP-L1]